MYSFCMLVEAVNQYVQKKVDPALLTFGEFYELINPRHKSHPETAYNYTVQSMNDHNEVSRYPILVKREVSKGITFDIRMYKNDLHEKGKYVKTDPQGNPVTINNELQYYTKEELEKLGYRRYEYGFAAVHDGKIVGIAQDEWGCVLVAVAQEYSGFDLGKVLAKLAWEAEPGKDSGGCTSKGYHLVMKVHKEFVSEYLRNGFYSHLVHQGVLTSKRAKEIIDSVQVKSKPKNKDDFNTSNPKNWLLYGDMGVFIIYDKKLRNIIEQEGDDEYYWKEEAIKGYSYVTSGYHSDKLRLFSLGGVTDDINKFMLLLAVTWANEEDDPLYIEKEYRKYVDDKLVDMDEQGLANIKKPIDYKEMVREEKKFRKSFDKYDEFYVRLLELADRKYK